MQSNRQRPTDGKLGASRARHGASPAAPGTTSSTTSIIFCRPPTRTPICFTSTASPHPLQSSSSAPSFPGPTSPPSRCERAEPARTEDTEDRAAEAEAEEEAEGWTGCARPDAEPARLTPRPPLANPSLPVSPAPTPSPPDASLPAAPGLPRGGAFVEDEAAEAEADVDGFVLAGAGPRRLAAADMISALVTEPRHPAGGGRTRWRSGKVRRGARGRGGGLCVLRKDAESKARARWHCPVVGAHRSMRVHKAPRSTQEQRRYGRAGEGGHTQVRHGHSFVRV